LIVSHAAREARSVNNPIFPMECETPAPPMTDIAKETELLRLAALRNYKVLDKPREEPFDRITRLARTIFHAPIALVSLVDQDGQWFKSYSDLTVCQIPRSELFCTHTIDGDVPVLVPDALADPRFRDLPMVTGESHIRSYFGVPLRMPEGNKVGAICVMDTKVRQYDMNQIGILYDLAQLVMGELELRLVATTDSLTGAFSRRAFLKAGARDMAGMRQEGKELTCVMLDVDHFKSINDKHGHAVGDRALQEIVKLLKAGLRGEDYLGRIGGEEFAVILPGAGRAAALGIGDRLRRRVMDAALTIPSGELKLTVSVGVATLKGDDACIEDLLARADGALYEAKATGRNRLVFDDSPPLVVLVH
jgi:diguanylate cyclase (GGDEF)-like protein